MYKTIGMLLYGCTDEITLAVVLFLEQIRHGAPME